MLNNQYSLIGRIFRETRSKHNRFKEKLSTEKRILFRASHVTYVDPYIYIYNLRPHQRNSMHSY